MKDGLDCHGVCISFHVPSLHSCEHCTTVGKLSMGHHKDWCLNLSEKKERTVP